MTDIQKRQIIEEDSGEVLRDAEKDSALCFSK